MSTGWAASPSELLMKAATRAAGRRRSTVRRRLTLIVGLALLALAKQEAGGGLGVTFSGSRGF